MRKKYLVLTVVLVAVLAIFNTTKVSSNINFVRQPASNDPVNPGSCAVSACHGTSLASNSSLLTLKISTDQTLSQLLTDTFHYVPNQTYYVAFQITDPTAYAFGFQFTGLTASNGHADAFTVTNTQHTRKSTYNGQNYMSHLNANNAISSWVFQWTAPAAGVGPVTFYYGFNPSDSSDYANAIPGNVTYAGTVKIFEEGVSGISDISTKISNLNIFPNPVSHEFGLSFNLKQTEVVSASVYSLDGKLGKELVNDKLDAGNVYRTFDISGLASGIYLVKMNVGDAVVTQKIIKE